MARGQLPALAMGTFEWNTSKTRRIGVECDLVDSPFNRLLVYMYQTRSQSNQYQIGTSPISRKRFLGGKVIVVARYCLVASNYSLTGSVPSHRDAVKVKHYYPYPFILLVHKSRSRWLAGGGGRLPCATTLARFPFLSLQHRRRRRLLLHHSSLYFYCTCERRVCLSLYFTTMVFSMSRRAVEAILLVSFAVLTVGFAGFLEQTAAGSSNETTEGSVGIAGLEGEINYGLLQMKSSEYYAVE